MATTSQLPAAAADMATTTSPAKKVPDRKTDRKVINCEGRQMVAKVYHFMKNEAANGVSRLKNASWRTAQATGVSVRTVENILREEKKLASTSGKFVDPMSRRKKRANKTDVDGSSAEIIRKTIEEYKAEHKKLPSLNNLKQMLFVKIQFNGSASTLRKILLKLGLEWRRLPFPVKRRPKGTVPPKEPKGKRSKSEKKELLKETPSEKPPSQASAENQRSYPMEFVAPQYNIFNAAPPHPNYDINYPIPRNQESVYPMYRVQDPLYHPQAHDTLVEHSKLDAQYRDNRANPRPNEQC